jgi:hypothetical protein
MKKIYFIFCLALISKSIFPQIGYNLTSVGGTFANNGAPTNIINSGIDDGLSATTAIGFTFQYGCVNYTQFKASSNGWLTFNTAVTGSNLTNNLATSTDRPIIAPLWDDLATGSGGNVNYQLSGVVGARVLTIEWKQMEWSYSATTWGLSFQVKLYETSNRIEFIYDRNGNASANLSGPSASIGLGGPTSGDYYSLNGTGVAPTASKVLETTNLSTKPANGQIYRWDPIICSGAPTAGTANAIPTYSCGAFNTTLSVTGQTSSCGLLYQWQSSAAAAGPFVNFGGATSSYTSTGSVPAASVQYFRCVVICGVLSSTTTVVSATAAAIPVCTCNQLVTLPFVASGQTTCGQSNDITSTNVTSICGSASYYGGEDVVYSFIPTTTGQITMSLTSTGSSTGLMLYAGCPLSGGTCVANSQSGTGSKSLCANVTAGVTYYLIVDSWSPTCNPYDITISSPASSALACNMAYVASATTFSFDVFTGTTLPSTDDILFNTVLPFTFPLCFDGNQIWGGYAASNSSLVFDALPCYPNIAAGTVAAPGIWTGWSITAPAPVYGTSIPRNAVLGPWHDIDPGLGGVMQYTVLGTTPNRRFVLSFENIPLYSCGANPATDFSGQIKVFETSNTIEIHIKQKKTCPGHNSGGAVMGLHNFDGTVYIPPVNATAHNVNTALTYTWNLSNTAYKFTTTCGSGGGSCSTLPIGLKSFYAERLDKINYLYWETATESNLKKYSVERSLDGINFTEIGYVTPNNMPSKYSFEDRNATLGIVNYYRICTYELDGTKSYTFIYPLATGNDELLNVSQIFPNPTNSSFTFAFDSKQKGTAIVNITDIFGKVVKSIPYNVSVGITEQKIEVEDLSSGIYFVEIINSFNEVITKQKLVKQN